MEIRIKKIKLIAMVLYLTSIFVCTAYAGTNNQETSISVYNDALSTVSTEYEQEIEADINPTGIFPPTTPPPIEFFQVKRVRLYPAYTKPGDTEIYYDKNKYLINTIPGNDYGYVNLLSVSPEKTEKLLHSFDDIEQEVTLWIMEMDCYAANFKKPARYEFKSEDGNETISTAARNGTTKFSLIFPVQDTINQYSNGLQGSFSYYTDWGNKYATIFAGGYVYLNDNNMGLK